MAAKPSIVDRETWQKQIEGLRAREHAHTHEGDAIAAARRRLPMVEIDASTPLVGAKGKVTLLEAFEGRAQLFGSWHMWHDGLPAADQCEGCTFFTGQARELSYLRARGVTFAVFCQGPYPESSRYARFMGWTPDMPWYSVPKESYEALGVRFHPGHGFGMKACYLRDGDRVFETYWTTSRGVEPMAGAYGMLDMTVYGRQEDWEDSPEGWPKRYGMTSGGNQFRETEPWQGLEGREKLQAVTNQRKGVSGRPSPQWARLAAGHSDDIGAANGAGKSEN